MMGLADRVGTLEAGKEADIVIVPGDPLADPHALEHVRLVIRAGRLVARDGQIVASGTGGSGAMLAGKSPAAAAGPRPRPSG